MYKKDLMLIMSPMRLQLSQAACSRLQAAMPCNGDFTLFSTLAVKDALNVVANTTAMPGQPKPNIDLTDYEFRYYDVYVNISRMDGAGTCSPLVYVEFMDYFLTEAWDVLVEANYVLQPHYDLRKVSFREFDIVLHAVLKESAYSVVSDSINPKALTI